MTDFYKRLNIRMFFALIAIMLSVFLIACEEPQKKDGIDDPYDASDDGATASFYVQEVTGSSTVLTTTRGLKLPQSRIYNFKACFRDKVTQNLIKGHTFRIVEEGKMEQDKQSDENGCVDWSEPLGYNFLADSRYVVLERTFTAVGVHDGTRTVRLAVNPWSKTHDSGIPEVVDLRHDNIASDQMADGVQEVQRSLFGASADGEISNRFLWVDKISSVHTQTEVGADGTILNLDLAFSPQLLVRNVTGQTQTINLSDGQFIVTPYIVAVTSENGNEVRTLLSNRDNVSRARGEVVNGRVRVSLQTLIYYESTFGQVELALHIQPVNGPSHLRSYEGVFLLGDYRRIGSGGTGEVRPYTYGAGSDFTLRDYVENARVLSAYMPDGQIPPNFIRANNFEFSNLNIRFLRIAPGETSTQRTVEFRIETCVRNPLNGMRVLGERFVVSRGGTNSTVEVRTNSEGCINWTDRKAHFYYQQEKLQRQVITISHRSGFRKELTMILNPWDFGWTFGFDSRAVENSYIDAVNRNEKERSRLFIPGFYYTTLRFRYEVDEFLTLKVKKLLLFEMRPRVLRYNSITRGRNATEPLRDGVYLARFALQKDYFVSPNRNEQGERDTAEYLSVVEKLVRVQDGRIITTVEFGLRDLRLMRMRVQLLVELSTIDETRLGQNYMTNLVRPRDVQNLQELVNTEESGLEDRTFLAPLVLINNKFSASFRPTDDLDEVSCDTADCNELITDEIRARYDLTDSELGAIQQINDPELMAKYYQDYSHLSGAKVRQMVDDYQRIEEEYAQKMREASRFSNYVETTNMEYAQVYNDAPILDKFTEEELERNNKALGLHPSARLRSLLARDYGTRGSPRAAEISDEDLESLVVEGRMTGALMRQFCNVFVNDILENVERRTVSLFIRDADQKRNQIISECLSKGEESLANMREGIFDENSVFSIEQKLRVHNVKTFLPRAGFSLNFNVGTTFGFGRSNYRSFTQSWAYKNGTDGIFALLKDIPIVGSLVGLLGGISFSVQDTQGEGGDVREGATVSSGTYLASQQKHMNLVFSEYEPCVALKLSPNFIQDSSLYSELNPNLDPDELLMLFTRGIFYCLGRTVEQDTEVRETYYYFTQHFTEGDMLDNAELVNHPWLLGMRGIQDYYRFLRSINLTSVRFDEDAGEFTEMSPEDARRANIDLADMPLGVMRDAYKKHTPSFPGFYTITDQTDKTDEY